MTSESFSLVITSGWCKGFTSCSTEGINFKDKTRHHGLPDYPAVAHDVAGGMVGQTLLSCGGEFYNGTYNAIIATCYQMGSNVPVALLKKARASARAVTVGNKLWITGGFDDSLYELKSTEFVDPDCGTVQDGPDLPHELSSHCLVMVNSTLAMLLGGLNTHFYTDYQTWFYNFENEDSSWVEGPTFIQSRYSHVCGKIKDLKDGKTVIVAAGGIFDESTEVLIPDSGEWIIGPNLPHERSEAVGLTTPSEDSFLLIGGYNYDTTQEEDSIYKLQCYNLDCAWTKLDLELLQGRVLFLAAFVPNSVLSGTT